MEYFEYRLYAIESQKNHEHALSEEVIFLGLIEIEKGRWKSK